MATSANALYEIILAAYTSTKYVNVSPYLTPPETTGSNLLLQ
jgi:hypothetical protein